MDGPVALRRSTVCSCVSTGLGERWVEHRRTDPLSLRGLFDERGIGTVLVETLLIGKFVSKMNVKQKRTVKIVISILRLFPTFAIV